MKKFFFPAFLLFWLINSAATLHTAPLKPVQASGTPESSRESCFLGYVTGLSTVSISPTSITLTWNPVKGAAYYRVKTFDSVNHAFISSTMVVAKASNNGTTVIDLIPGVSYSITVAGVCSNGHESL